MGCCDKPEGKEIPRLSGEIKIWNEDSSITTVSLAEKDIWLIRVLLKDGVNRARNEPGWANGEAKAALIELADKLVPKEDQGCGTSGCCSR